MKAYNNKADDIPVEIMSKNTLEKTDKVDDSVAAVVAVLYILSVVGGFVLGGLTGGLIGNGVGIIFIAVFLLMHAKSRKASIKRHNDELSKVNIDPGVYKCKEFYNACVKMQQNPYSSDNLTYFKKAANMCGGIEINSISDAQQMYLLGSDKSGLNNIMKLIGIEAKKSMESDRTFYALCKQNGLEPGVNGTLRDYKLLAQRCYGFVTINSIEDALREYRAGIVNIDTKASQIENNMDEIINGTSVKYREKILSLSKKEAGDVTAAFDKTKYIGVENIYTPKNSY